MDAVALLNKHIDHELVLNHYDFDRVRVEGNMIRSACKLHGGNNPSAFVMNPETGLWYCHTGDCGGGDIYTLVRKLDECSFEESVKIIADLFGIDIANMEVAERKSDTMKELQKWVKTMTAWNRRVELKPYELEVPVREVTKFRDFKEETLQHFKLGFIDEMRLEKSSGGMYALRDRLSIPIVQGNIQVGVSLRKTKGKDYPKWSHQPRGLNTSNLLYNYDATNGQKTIVIVEGAFDVWAFYEIGVVAVATYGAHLTDEQYKMLIRTGADLVFAYDGDEAGKNATEKATKLLKFKADLEYVAFGENQDPASITREELKTLYESRRKL